MKSKTVLLSAVAAITLNAPGIAHSYEFDPEQTTNLIMEMIVDLGGHDAVGKNSGKTMPCNNGGTRKVSIAQKGSISTYTGDYRNCREKSAIRDGLYEIVLDGDEIINSSSKRSINGELFDAAQRGDIASVRKLLKAKADVNYTESIKNTEGGYINEWTPLMSAVMSGNLDTVKLLVSKGAWVNYLNSLAVNALWIAANTGHTDIVKYLVQQGAYINNRNSEDVTPLMAAAMNGHFDIVKSLIAAGANINFVHKEGDTALMFALGGGHTAIARQLIEAGADVNVKNRFGTTALHIAVAEGNQDGVTMLLERKADVNIRSAGGKTALDVARAKGLTNIAELIKRAQTPSQGKSE